MPYKRRRSTGQLNHRVWRRLRDRVVREEPLCQLRLAGVCTRWSQTGDHITPVSVAPHLRFVRANVQGACHACNRFRKDMPIPVARAKARAEAGIRAQPPAKALEFFG